MSEQEDFIEAGDDFPVQFSQVPAWITLHPDLSAQALREYSFLALHVRPGRPVAFPGKEMIAKVIGVSRADKVTPHTRALERAGAVTVHTVKSPRGRHYRYVVHFQPPKGYSGPLSLTDFYADAPRKKDRWEGFSMATATPSEGDNQEVGQNGSPPQGGHPSELGFSTDVPEIGQGSPSQGGHGWTPEQGHGWTPEQGPNYNKENHTNPNQEHTPAAPGAALTGGECVPDGESPEEIGERIAREMAASLGLQVPQQRQEAVALPGGMALVEGTVVGAPASWEAGWQEEDRWNDDEED